VNKSLSTSIVLYNNSDKQINDLLACISTFNFIFILVVDNSSNDNRKIFFNNDNFIYIHNAKNFGFGRSHNLAIPYIRKFNSKYHLILNPDIIFQNVVIDELLVFLDNNSDTGSIMPQILNFDGSIQFLPKLIPSPLDILIRKFNFLKFIFKSRFTNYEMKSHMLRKVVCNVPIISGCFFIIRSEIIEKIGLFDDKYFLYFEDWDLSRRIHRHYKTIYYPLVSIYHGYQSDANKNFKIFILFFKSFFTYFNKWGWFFDNERKASNKNALLQ
jgi:GT2 family glycosyltransferase